MTDETTKGSGIKCGDGDWARSLALLEEARRELRAAQVQTAHYPAGAPPSRAPAGRWSQVVPIALASVGIGSMPFLANDVTRISSGLAAGLVAGLVMALCSWWGRELALQDVQAVGSGSWKEVLPAGVAAVIGSGLAAVSAGIGEHHWLTFALTLLGALLMAVGATVTAAGWHAVARDTRRRAKAAEEAAAAHTRARLLESEVTRLEVEAAQAVDAAHRPLAYLRQVPYRGAE